MPGLILLEVIIKGVDEQIRTIRLDNNIVCFDRA